MDSSDMSFASCVFTSSLTMLPIMRWIWLSSDAVIYRAEYSQPVDPVPNPI
jgi:hypothetical protein